MVIATLMSHCHTVKAVARCIVHFTANAVLANKCWFRNRHWIDCLHWKVLVAMAASKIKRNFERNKTESSVRKSLN